MDTGIGKGVLEIATALMSIALIALIINKAGDVSKVVSSVTTGFGDLLRIVTLQNK